MLISNRKCKFHVAFICSLNTTYVTCFYSIGCSRTCWSERQPRRPGISRTQGKTYTPYILLVLENTFVPFSFERKLRNETKHFLPVMVVWSGNMCNVLKVLMTAIDVLCIYCKLHDCTTL